MVASNTVVFVDLAPTRLFNRDFFSFNAQYRYVSRLIFRYVFHNVTANFNWALGRPLHTERCLLDESLPIDNGDVRVILPRLAGPTTIDFTNYQ